MFILTKKSFNNELYQVSIQNSALLWFSIKLASKVPAVIIALHFQSSKCLSWYKFNLVKMTGSAQSEFQMVSFPVQVTQLKANKVQNVVQL